MPVHKVQPSPKYLDAADKGLATLVGLSHASAGLALDPFPQPVYVTTLKPDSTQPGFQPENRQVAWRYFAGSMPREVVSIEVSMASPPKIVRLQYGDPARQAFQDVERVMMTPDFAEKEVDLRLLRIPGALAEVIWLKPSDQEKGVIVPVKTFDQPSRRFHPQGYEDFFKTLQPIKNRTSDPETTRPAATAKTQQRET